jgi:hypothetical protein
VKVKAAEYCSESFQLIVASLAMQKSEIARHGWLCRLFASAEQCSAKLCHYQALQVAARSKIQLPVAPRRR